MLNVLFVCTGNICRSPTAEGVFRDLVRVEGLDGRIAADSAGTHGYHIGEAPDSRSILAARRRGYDLSPLRARRVRSDDFHRFDLILAMDRGHMRELSAACPPDQRHRLRLFLEFAPQFDAQDVPDPYYGGSDGFALVLDMAEAGARGILDHFRALYEFTA